MKRVVSINVILLFIILVFATPVLLLTVLSQVSPRVTALLDPPGLYPYEMQEKQVALSKQKGVAPAIYKLGLWKRTSLHFLPLTDALTVRLDIPPKKSDRSNWESVACMQMLLAYRQEYFSQEEMAKEVGAHIDSLTDIKEMPIFLNKALFGYKNGIPPSDQAAGYRIANLEDEWQVNAALAKQNFETRLKQNIKDGYPMICCIHGPSVYNESVMLYPKASSYVLCTGYEIDETGSITSVYFNDPWASFILGDRISATKYKDADKKPWKSIKTCALDDLLQAIRKSANSSYIW